ncbi:DUF4294 domain-containing protein [Winogradskyella bathintestinalis]|uniref:DUF4294 domain-containing protein n=1 Tax=Winogradskyella bathintestinalis TaxID=3035208 RepID=A0ABT7ZW53_9FLAO|nr:DUF4294 domain-containing protein [Winogradskyella bathintestinalis]MDN3493166.1 DUF4294 domain-containing protein [Winogradskyella bathintestinalis]
MKYIVYITLLFAFVVHGQQDPVKQDSTIVNYMIIDGDSIPVTAVELNEVLVLPRLKFEDKASRIRYIILRRKTLKVYPYAKLAAERLEDLQKRLNALERNSDKRRYAKIIQNYIEDEFSAELKKLTKTEGQILVKLIHRQTGKTTFDLIKELRSGWRAFWFNNTAKLFDISLKKEFDPIIEEEDYLIEDILQRAFRNERLKRQEPAFNIDFYACVNKWSKPKTSSNSKS